MQPGLHCLSYHSICIVNNQLPDWLAYINKAYVNKDSALRLLATIDTQCCRWQSTVVSMHRVTHLQCTFSTVLMSKKSA